MRIKSPKSIVSRPTPTQTNQTTTSHNPVGSNQSDLKRLMQERLRLKAAEHASFGSIKKNLQRKGDIVGRRIGDLQMKQRRG